MAKDITIVGLGEALFDVLPGGRVLGGAPLNVACHVHQLIAPRGGRGIVASRVGMDALGEEVGAELACRGMTVDHLQRDEHHATSTVDVHLEAGQPTYTFAADIAWDHLEFTREWAGLASQCTAVCYGTLAQRTAQSRAVIWQFLDAATEALRLFDVNLRQGFYDQESIAEGCRRASIVKLNEEELPVAANLLSLPAGPPVFQLAQLRARYDLQAVVYTRGKRGTMLVLEDKVVAPPAVSYPASPNADSVGAGDACAAGILIGWTGGMPPARIAELANHLGAFVASQAGATPQLPQALIEMAG